MRIHSQNLPGMMGDAVTMDDWVEAAARAGLADECHEVSLGQTLENFCRAAPEMEALVVRMRHTSE